MTMTSTTATPTPSRRPSSGGRTVALVASILLALFGVGLLVGGVATFVTAQQRDADGFLTGEPQRFSTGTYAISTPEVTVSSTGPDAADVDALIGKVRVRVEAADPGTSVFIGVGPAAEVAAYLAKVDHDTVNHLDTGPFEVSYERHAGGRPATPPVAQSFWIASDSGTGQRSVTWPVASGGWVVVVMNTDASAGVEADVTAGVTLPILRPIAISMLVAGGLLVPIGAALIIVTRATRRRGLQVA